MGFDWDANRKPKVTTYGAAINELENAGEVNLKLSMHSINKSDGSATLTMTSTKNVCFVLDPPKNRDGKKRKAQCFQIMLTNCYYYSFGPIHTSPKSHETNLRFEGETIVYILHMSGKKFCSHLWGKAIFAKAAHSRECEAVLAAEAH